MSHDAEIGQDNNDTHNHHTIPPATEDYSHTYAYTYPPPPQGFIRSRQSSISSTHSCEGLSADETRELWKCMLELQLRYGCYNSTRMDLAVNAGDDAVDLMPNPFILDTLNDSVIDLPEEGWEMLSRHLRHDESRPKKKSSLRFLRRHSRCSSSSSCK
ncbi:hypothetical protein PT974_10868 [Cladobotryum mycophilum]|uniref:Uncharacterized protein n=1 Tax=Cladobotryum mycophilum TaxID=491253 RepID=A0ABR0SB18_9HYPO